MYEIQAVGLAIFICSKRKCGGVQPNTTFPQPLYTLLLHLFLPIYHFWPLSFHLKVKISPILRHTPEMSLLSLLPDDQLTSNMSDWLDFRSLGVLDNAITSNNERLRWLKCICSISDSAALNSWHYNHLEVGWLIKRGISPQKLHLIGHSSVKYRIFERMPYRITEGTIINWLQSYKIHKLHRNDKAYVQRPTNLESDYWQRCVVSVRARSRLLEREFSIIKCRQNLLVIRTSEKYFMYLGRWNCRTGILKITMLAR